MTFQGRGCHTHLNFCALWKKQTTLPYLAYAGMPYQSLGERVGDAVSVQSGERMAAIHAEERPAEGSEP